MFFLFTSQLRTEVFYNVVTFLYIINQVHKEVMKTIQQQFCFSLRTKIIAEVLSTVVAFLYVIVKVHD